MIPVSPLFATGQHLELTITARPGPKHPDAGEWFKWRDVYLCEQDPKDKGGRSCFLYHTDCPEAVTRRLIVWAESLGIPIIQDPPGNLADGWKWPDDEPPAPAAPVYEPSF